MTAPPRLLASQDGRVLTVRFNNPPRHFFDEQMSVEFDDLVRALSRDRTVGAVIFTGQDSTYLTHADVPELLRGARLVSFGLPYAPARALTLAAAAAARSRRLDRALRQTKARELTCLARVYGTLRRLNRMDKVVITAINGLALGMGCIFALSCDIRLMADDTHIGLPETGLGIIAAAGGTQRLVRMVGTSRALELLLEGRRLTAAEATGLGLVHRAVAPADLLDEATATAARLARRPPTINREIKRMIYDAGTLPFSRAAHREAASFLTSLSTDAAHARLAGYQHWLADRSDPTDDAIEQGFRTLLENPTSYRAGQ